MKMNSTDELRQKDENTLKDELLVLLREQFNLRMQKSDGSVVKPHLFKQLRQSIARIRTILNEKSKLA